MGNYRSGNDLDKQGDWQSPMPNTSLIDILHGCFIESSSSAFAPTMKHTIRCLLLQLTVKYAVAHLFPTPSCFRITKWVVYSSALMGLISRHPAVPWTHHLAQPSEFIGPNPPFLSRHPESDLGNNVTCAVEPLIHCHRIVPGTRAGSRMLQHSLIFLGARPPSCFHSERADDCKRIQAFLGRPTMKSFEYMCLSMSGPDPHDSHQKSPSLSAGKSDPHHKLGPPDPGPSDMDVDTPETEKMRKRWMHRELDALREVNEMSPGSPAGSTTGLGSIGPVTPIDVGHQVVRGRGLE
ncbi:hypothetical protein BD779DRAFT_1721884 [Infundibulicybe gibba]|nr:hypothetical protein BD779DRAFT_1721884 [Infundibulicybe gibba]